VTERIRAFVWLAAIVAFICVMPATARASQFLSDEIETALSKRDVFLKTHGSPEEAVKAAAADPGMSWLLALEFIRDGQTEFADDCFDNIEAYILAVGGSSAPLLAQQLIFFGNTFAASEPDKAEYCYTKARRFDKNQCWWRYKMGAADFPNNVIDAIPSFIYESLGLLATSWRAQVAFISWAYRFLAATIFIFACALFVVFSVKYLPSGVHPIGDTLFAGASPRVRTAAGVVTVVAVLAVGVVPALWIIAFLICRFMNAKEKKLLILACAILTLSPLNFFVDNLLSRSLRPDSPAVLLDRSIREGYSVGLYNSAKANLSKRPGNYATGLTLAVCETKSENYGANSDAIIKALDVSPDDPLTLLYAGNHAFLTDDIDGMKQYYGTLLKNDPNSAEAKFNLAQAYANDANFTASDMISEAAKIDASLIGGYMRVNTHYFGDDVPPLRRIIQPTLTPFYFWSHLFLADLAELARFNAEKTYFGLSPIAAFGVSAFLMIVFLCVYAAVWKYESKVRKYFTCRICGRLLCKRCRKGTICSVCYKKSIESHDNAATMYNLQKKYQDKAVLRKDFIKFALGIVIPGSNALYKGETFFKPAVTILITSAVFAACYCAVTFHTYYPSAAVIDPIYLVPILLLYNIIAFFKQCVRLAATMKNRAKMSIKSK